MFSENTKIVFGKLPIGAIRQEGRGRQEGVFSPLDAFFQEVCGRDAVLESSEGRRAMKRERCHLRPLFLRQPA